MRVYQSVSHFRRTSFRGQVTVAAEKRVRDEVMPLGSSRTVEVVSASKPSLPGQDPNKALQFYMTVSELQRSVRGANGKVDETLDQLAQIKAALRSSARGDARFFEEARRLELELKDVSTLLVGRTVKTRRSEPDRLSIMNRLNSALSTSDSTHGPTQTHRRDYRIAREEFDAVIGRLRELIEDDFMRLQTDIEGAGLPWTSGRPIPDLR